MIRSRNPTPRDLPRGNAREVRSIGPTPLLRARGRNDDWRDNWHLVSRALCSPAQKLHHAVDLIIMPAVWEGEQLAFELDEPWRRFGQQDAARLEGS